MYQIVTPSKPMKILTRIFLLAYFSSMATASYSQPPNARPADCAKQTADLQAKLADWPGLQRYRTANEALPAAAANQPRVIFFGDSITDSWVSNGGTFFPGKAYLNRGISGQTTPQMLVRFRQDVIDPHPQVVVILAGTNDIAGNTGPMTARMIEGNFRSMAELAKANNIRVIFSSILPVADYPWRKGLEPAPEIRLLNAWLREYSASHGLTYLDYYTPMAGPDGGMRPGISIDGVHPNGKGYAIMEPLAQAAIDKALRR